MPRLPAQGDSHGNLLWKIVENTFAGGVGGGGIGPAGPAGPTGPAGADGAAGAQGPSGDLTPGIESLADATAIWLTAAERVGIGTSAPDGLLHVFSGSAGVTTPPAFADELVIEGSGDTGLSFLSPNTTVQSITFGDPEDNDAGSFNYNHAVNVLSLQVNSTEYVYFNGTQVGIGINTPDGTLHIATGSAGVVTPQAFADELVIEGSGDIGMSFLSPNTTVQSITFGDPEDNDAGSFNYNHALNVLSTQVGGVEFFYLVSSARVGIGTNAPDGPLHIFSGSAGIVTADTTADGLVIEDSVSTGISILTPANADGSILFGDPDNAAQGFILYDHLNDILKVEVGSGGRIQITTADNDLSLFSGGALFLDAVSDISIIAPIVDISGTDNFVGGTNFRVFSTNIGFFGVAAVVQQVSGANLTNSVTVGGTDDTIANFTDLTVYANDAATIRNDIYQLARKLKQVNDALRLYGLLT